MNTFLNKKVLLFFLLLFTAFYFSSELYAQEQQLSKYVLSIENAIQLAKANNSQIQIATLEGQAIQSDLKDIKSHALPSVAIKGSGRRLTDVTLFEHGISQSETVPAPPTNDMATVGIEASFNLYSGGKHEAAIEEQKIKSKLADINLKDQTGSVSLQVVSLYLDILRLQQLDSLYSEQIKREDLRYKNIQSLYNNGKVTRSDLLRAEINLSNQQFSKKENSSDIEIQMQRMNILLQLPEHTSLLLSDTTVIKKVPSLTTIYNLSGERSYKLLKATENIDLQEAKIKGVKSNYYPSIELFSEYGYNYPNSLIFPPVDQIYSVGYIGIKLQYSISSLYQNNHKNVAEKIRLTELKMQQNAIKDNTHLEISSLKIKYNDMLEKIAIAEKNIEQSKVNYKIVSTKYFNQLALLTDLLDADNLYLQSRYNLIKAQTDLCNYYYNLLYTTGNL